jgi:lantibiotic biosynthesis protein
VVSNTLISIEQQISDYVNRKEEFHLSLMTSHSGIALFYAYLYLSTRNAKHLDTSFNILSDCVNFMSEGLSDATLANGFTGVAWTIQHFKGLDLVDLSSIEGLKEIEKSIGQSIDSDLQAGNYDLFYGAIGKGIYFLEASGSANSIQYLEKIVLGLERLAIKDGDGLTWMCNKFGKEKEILQYHEIGLAHGISSIISFLSRVYRLGILKKKTLYLLEGSLKWLIKKRKTVGKYSYPITIPQDGRREWLAWCTGDLGVGIAIYHASVTLSSNDLTKEAIRVFKNSCLIDFAESGIHVDRDIKANDAGLCHGCIGLGYIYKKIFDVTHDVIFKERAEYWTSCSTILWQQSPNTYHEILRFNGDKGRDKWVKDYGLLEGLSGIGLMLLFLNGSKENDWDKLFLLDTL